MTLTRRLEPELLDELPAHDPRARRARRDLARINSLFGLSRVMARLLEQHAQSKFPRTWLELGAGDGTFTLSVARRLAPRWPNVHVMLLDQQNIVSDETRRGFVALGWTVETITEDVFAFLSRAHTTPIDVITANLFIHHFPDERLAWLLERAAHLSNLFVACEPQRSRFAVRLTRLSWTIGCGEVFVHDAIVSLRAGFTGKELSGLWPRQDAWRLEENEHGLVTHCFAAVRS
ncbi:MAG: methyltransferase domain-containing protein [Rhizobiales bacterium]|nr:methyltransferase domain-containing protein [Hyphomicrobiales bacterium]